MTQIYATQVTQYYLNAVAAAEAGGAALNIAGGTLVVGDGNGVIPALSALIAANGVTHEVWRGQTISSVAVDLNNAAQLDIGCVIPVAIGGVEIGPFRVTEFAILDAGGNCCVVGTTDLQKTTSAQGQTSDLAWTAAVAAGVGAVTVTPPSAGFATMTQVINGVNANLPSCIAPLTKTDTTNSLGWLNRVFGIRNASQPAGTTSTQEASALGAGRAATDAEFAAGAPESGAAMIFPWPTLQQIHAALSALWAALGSYLPLAGGTLTGALTLAGAPTTSLHAASKGYVDGRAPTVANVGIAADVALANSTQTNVTNLSGAGNSNVAVAGSGLTIANAGLYQIDVNAVIDVAYSASSNYWATATLYRNGAVLLYLSEGAYYFGSATSGVGLTGTRTLALNAGDVVTLQVEAFASSWSSSALIASQTFIDIVRLA
jgi:hypothetical protein